MENFLFGIIFNEVFNQIVTVAAAGIAGFFIAKFTGFTKKERARVEIDKITVREYITNAYNSHVIQGHPVTQKRREELDRAFDAYTTLGGNGTARQFMDAIREIPVTLVVE